ncbi:MAG: hypothetical protein KAT49_01705 [Methanomicrobia archaeon]|nr:hypothetical protein [Methanomicrobia archaeon]
MELKKDLTPQKIKLLENLEKSPYMTDRELAEAVGYSYKCSVVKLKNFLEDIGYISPPFYQIDYGKLAKNKLSLVNAVIMFDGDYAYIRDLLSLIESYHTIYPVVEQDYPVYLISFFVTEEGKIREILEYLRKKRVILYYELFKYNFRWHFVYPTFSIKKDPDLSTPNFEDLFAETEIPDIEYGKYEGYLDFCDTRMVMHLEVGTGTLTKIQKYEHEKFGNSFSYLQLKNSYKKLTKKRIAIKYYDIRPVPNKKCHRGLVLIRCDDFEMTKRLVFNVGKGKRVLEKITYWKSGDEKREYGVIQFFYDSVFFTKFLMGIDNIKEIIEKKMFFLRTFPTRYWKNQSVSMEYYDLKKQELHFPYDKFFEAVKSKVDQDTDNGVLDKKIGL